MKTQPVKIVETVLRDGHQSLEATRMRTSDMIPALEQLDDVGYYALEAWGGATFDTCLRYLDEDPWERLRAIRKHVHKTKLQMLLRGQNILGYNHYADDVVREFVFKSVENGIDIIRIFDALNDVRNLECAIRAAKEAGMKHITLIEEPLAAFYAWLDSHQQSWQKNLAAGDAVLVMDVGGGTTDFTLVRIEKDAVIRRHAVGDHLGIQTGDEHRHGERDQPRQPRFRIARAGTQKCRAEAAQKGKQDNQEELHSPEV